MPNSILVELKCLKPYFLALVNYSGKNLGILLVGLKFGRLVV